MAEQSTGLTPVLLLLLLFVLPLTSFVGVNACNCILSVKIETGW